MLQVGEFGALETIGANLIFSSRNTYPMMVTANCKTTVIHIHKDTIMKLSQDNNEFMLALLRTVSDKVIVLADKINQISMQSIRDRIIEFLKYECCIQMSNVIKLNISKTLLAEKFGIQRSSLSRELNKMRRDGMLEYDARTITIKNIDGITTKEI